MRGDPRAMTVVVPRSPQEAVKALVRDPKALPLAGGTDLMVGWNMGALNGRTIVDLSRLAAWRGVSFARGTWRAGALVTHSAAQAHKGLAKAFPLLAQACATVGAAQIQNRGTLGGNLANASPAGDTFPALAVYEARVVALGPGGRRTLPLLDLFAGVKKTTLRPAELIEAIELDAPRAAPARALFRKVGTRAAQAISKTVFAGLLWLDKRGAIADVRLALGSVAPTVRRLSAAEAFLKGRPLTPRNAAGAAELVADDISPIDDVRSTREYRLAVSKNILLRFLS